jgi:hypothetical protein
MSRCSEVLVHRGGGVSFGMVLTLNMARVLAHSYHLLDVC